MASIERVLADAKLLVSRLREHDSTADTLITQSTALHRRIDAMKQYQEDLTELNEMARHRPRSTLILSLVQENTRIRELQNENKELRNALEEHQSALELIMSKYREQIIKLVVANKLEKSSEIKDKSEEIHEKIEKIAEMAAVMQKAASIDEAAVTQQQEKLSQLKTENETLRKLLKQSLIQLRQLEGIDEGTQTGITSKDSTSSVESENLDETVICASATSVETSPKPSSQDAAKNKESSPGKSENSPEKSEEKSPGKKEKDDSDSLNDSEIDTGTIKKSTIKKKPKPKSKITPSKK